jgi:hypothetical protein
MSDKAEVTELGQVPNGVAGTKRGFGSRLLAHYKKWWWVHLIVTALVVMVVTLIVVYVGYPRIAQSDVNDSTLNVTKLVISSPTPNSYILNETQVLGTHAAFHPTIFGFSAAVSLAGANVFGYLDVPQTQATDGRVININQAVNLTDVSAFGEFSVAVMTQETVTLNVYGRPVLQQGALPKETITYNKSVTMVGLNNLNGFNVTSFKILSTPLSNGTNMEGTVLIPNPTVMTFDMGNITLDLAVNGTAIGQSFINDLVLVPGNNTFSMTSVVNETIVVEKLPKNGILPVTITGNSSVYNGEVIPYFTEALQANSLVVDLNVIAALSSSS